MRIGIHAAGLLPYRTGRECYVQALLGELARLDRENEYDILVSPANRHLFERPESNFHLVEMRLPRLPSRRLWENAYLRFAAQARRLDLIHLVESPLPFYQPTKALATVHDILPVLYPEHFPLKGRAYYQNALFTGTKRLRSIITVSERTKRDLVVRLQLEPRRIHVTYPGVEPRFAPITDQQLLADVRRKYRLPESFILYVGTLEPRKNVGRLLSVFRRLREKGLNQSLVLAGGKGWLCDDVLDAAKQMAGSVRLTGFVADEDLPALYNAADMFVFPSLYEGFGTPPLEAMACGLPVVCSNRASLPEVVGDAALSVDPEDGEAFGDAIWELAHDESLRQRLREAGLARARLFSWERTARGTLAQYDELLHGRSTVREEEEAADAA